MSDEFSPIRPKSVPLSHTQSETDKSTTSSRIPRLGSVVIGLMLAFGIGVFLLVPDWVETPEIDKKAVVHTPQDQTPSKATRSEPDLPPFQTLQREQARARAQEELAQFVELQLKLENTMQVGSWGQASFDTAKSLANKGDEQFLRDEFETAMDSYQSASDELRLLIENGGMLLVEALKGGQTALENRDQTVATERFQEALTIDPGNAKATVGLLRAGLIPEIARLMRKARNHELAEQWSLAVSTYKEVLALDEKTIGVTPLIQGARRQNTQRRVTQALSDGFAALDIGNLDSAQSGFRNAIKLNPGNQIALGGLEQVAEQRELKKIADLKKTGSAAEEREDWPAALAAYESILDVDDNIQFAVVGRKNAYAQRRANQTLGNIISNPDKLSSKQLFADAHRLLEEARLLNPRGKILGSQISQTESLLDHYGKPVPVTLRSDNATLVTLSTVGKLGSFEEKQLELRPGAYTLIGSRDGCKDVRQNILVRPKMMPVEIRCQKTF